MQAVQSVPLSQLKPAPWNPRTLRDTRFQQLCRSLEADPDFLEQRPVLAQADGTVYGGNIRLRAAMHLGWQTIPAILSDIPEQLAKERALKDNNQFGDWQEQELAELLAELQAGGSDLELLGFDDGRVQELLESVGLNGDADGSPDGDEPRPTLSDRFIVPPFSVLDARQGYWQERKRAWLALGIQSELGRGGPGAYPTSGRAAEVTVGLHASSAARRVDTGLLGESEQAEDYRQRRKSYAAPGGSPRPAATLGKNGRTVRGDGRGRVLDGKD